MEKVRLALLCSLIGLSCFMFNTACSVSDTDDDDDNDEGDDSSGENDDDNDNQTDDDASPDDDDDTSGNNDDDDNDDSPADDDNNNDTTTDDDDDNDDTMDLQLFIIAYDDEEHPVSWLQTATNWRSYTIPDPTAAYTEIGSSPSLVLNGNEALWVWNLVDGSWWPPSIWTKTAGHQYFTFNKTTGWSWDQTRDPAGDSNNIDILAGADIDALQAASHYLYYTEWQGGEKLLFRDAVYTYQGKQATMTWRQLFSQLTALFITPGNAGWAAGINISGSFLMRYETGAWQLASMPAGFETYYLTWFWLSDTDNGYAIAHNTTSFTTRLLALDNGSWSEIAPPSGCTGVEPTRVWSEGGHTIALDTTAEAGGRFWYENEGQWTCRQITTNKAQTTLLDALIDRTGDAFVLGLTSAEQPCLFRITPEAVEPLTLPTAIGRVERLHALGDNAPLQSVFYENPDFL